MEADDGYRCLFYEYCCETDCDPNAVRLQPGETVEYRWVSLEALRRMMDDGALIPSTRKRLERWLAVRGGD